MALYHKEVRVAIPPERAEAAGVLLNVFGVTGHLIQRELYAARDHFPHMAPRFDREAAVSVTGTMGQVAGMMDRFMEACRRQTEGAGRPVVHQVMEGMYGDALVLWGEDTLADINAFPRPLNDAEFVYAAGSALEEQVWQEFNGGVVMGLQIQPGNELFPHLSEGDNLLLAFAQHVKTLARSMKAFAEEEFIPALIPYQQEYEMVDLLRQEEALRERERNSYL